MNEPELKIPAAEQNESLDAWNQEVDTLENSVNEKAKGNLNSLLSDSVNETKDDSMLDTEITTTSVNYHEVTEDNCQNNEEIILQTPETEMQPMLKESRNIHKSTDIVPKPEPEHVTPESELKEEDFPMPPMSSEQSILEYLHNFM